MFFVNVIVFAVIHVYSTFIRFLLQCSIPLDKTQRVTNQTEHLTTV